MPVESVETYIRVVGDKEFFVRYLEKDAELIVPIYYQDSIEEELFVYVVEGGPETLKAIKSDLKVKEVRTLTSEEAQKTIWGEQAALEA